MKLGPVLGRPHPRRLAQIKRRRIKQIARPGHGDVVEELNVQPEPGGGGFGNRAFENFAAKGPEDDEPEGDFDVDDARAVADQAFGGGQQVEEADAQADFLDHLVGVFFVDVVFEGGGAAFDEIGGLDLDHVGYGSLEWEMSMGVSVWV